ncbi:hypothetical protein QN277_001494 [Acacia crassicarpa]|uniref:Uncharacterized protein n=1 Tax=Acacia crassicarpa TaxID=499986 RepID=A0AAE1N9T4_9FABA|nr:hypothetical protein QN277_001494 [Acacia crassicarpa]
MAPSLNTKTLSLCSLFSLLLFLHVHGSSARELKVEEELLEQNEASHIHYPSSQKDQTETGNKPYITSYRNVIKVNEPYIGGYRHSQNGEKEKSETYITSYGTSKRENQPYITGFNSYKKVNEPYLVATVTRRTVRKKRVNYTSLVMVRAKGRINFI